MATGAVLDYNCIVRVPAGGLPGAAESAGDIRLADAARRVSTVLIPEGCLRERVRVLGETVAGAYEGAGELLLLVVLKGAFVFAADLGRAIYSARGPEVKYDFIKASTYGTHIKKSGERTRRVKIELRPANVKGRDVLLVEDIVDQGFTLSKLKGYLLEKEGAASVKICALLDKKLEKASKEVRALREKLRLDFVGFEVPDRWIAGYGVDAGEDFRFLPHIIAVDEKYYRS